MKSMYIFLALALITGLTVAQERPPQKKDKKEPDDKATNLVARVAKDMQAAEERLKKTDPGDLTRKVQRDVVDGLEELIKQNSKQDNESGSGKSGKMQDGGRQQQSGGKGGASGKQGQRLEDQPGLPNPSPAGGKQADDSGQDEHGRAKGGKDGTPETANKEKGKGQSDGKDEKEAAGKEAGKDISKKDGDKSDEKGQAKGNDPGNSQGQQGGLASVKNAKTSKSKSSLTAETYRTDWGHLPMTKRLEMDAYSKERFMPRYDEMLQQYYKTVAEQGKKKE
jgi:hypothetical protein